MGGFHGRSALLAAALLLGACASDSTFSIAGRAPNPEALEEDASDCRSVGPALTGFFGGALVGAANGAQIGALSGAEPTTAIAGAVAGSVIGLMVGTYTAVSGDAYDRCMVAKGYQRVDTPQTAGEMAASEPIVITRRWIDDPAR